MGPLRVGLTAGLPLEASTCLGPMEVIHGRSSCHLFFQHILYLWKAYCAPGTVLDSWDTLAIQQTKWSLYPRRRRCTIKNIRSK